MLNDKYYKNCKSNKKEVQDERIDNQAKKAIDQQFTYNISLFDNENKLRERKKKMK